MGDALSSFYSDLATIDKSSDTSTSYSDIKSSITSTVDPLPGKQDLKISRDCLWNYNFDIKCLLIVF